MIVAISWLPKGAAKSVPAPAEPPSKEEVEEMLKSGVLQKSDEAENEEDNEEESDVEMNFDTSRNCEVEGENEDSPVNNVDLTEAMKELDMDNYDDEEDGISDPLAYDTNIFILIYFIYN
ncbi:unnamed protein product [Cuscuta campestris]|uniref:Uncharacterized protein n=1 Tax=Cuscuta campestris TaxID=132261 RepID=A0A484LGM2_9ASTE|nr:unnamed protein product [Cuscuta campestris]